MAYIRSNEFKGRLSQKHDTEANWLKATGFSPLVGEIIVYDVDETHDYPRIKIGDGETNVNNLPFVENLDFIRDKITATNITYATCSTAAATAAKEIVTSNKNWILAPGSRISVLFSYTNSAQNPTFNVNNTGAKSVKYSTTVITTSSLSYAGYANRLMDFVYDGTNYVFVGWSYQASYSNLSLGQGYGTCTTAAATTAKVASLSSYTLSKGGIVAIRFSNSVPANATLNVNSKGAKNIFYRGAKIIANIIQAGDLALFMYDGTQYQLLGVDRIATSITISEIDEICNATIYNADEVLY